MEMRIVGLNSLNNSNIFIQTKTGFGQWEQQIMSYTEFDQWMASNFPNEYSVYVKEHRPGEPAAQFFYNYGETEVMRMCGISYIYKK